MSLSNTTKSDSFELQTKADEWIDVTPTEEVLRAELARLQEAFEKCTTQLDSSRLENDLLKDRSLALEHETKQLESLLEGSQTNLENLQTELAAVQQTSKEERLSLEASLQTIRAAHASAQTSFQSLEAQLQSAHQQRLDAQQQQEAAHRNLERELKASKVEAKTHQQTAIRFAEDLRAVREAHKQTQRDLETAQTNLVAEKHLHSRAKKDLGTVATLAETLKVEKQSLQRSLSREQALRAETESKTAALTQHLADLQAIHEQKQSSLRSELTQRSKDLEGSNASLATLSALVVDTEQKLQESRVEQASIQKHLATMEQGRHELLERQSELEEALEEALDEKTAQLEKLLSTQELLETAVLERDTLRNQRSAYLQSSEREAELEAKLLEQKQAFEKRLKDIHAILGLKFTAVVQSEVRTIRKHAIQQLPRSFKVPLLAQQAHPARPQHVKSS